MKVRGWKKLFHVNGNQKSSNITAGTVMFISEKKKDFKGYCKRQKGKYVMIKRLRRKYNNYK